MGKAPKRVRVVSFLSLSVLAACGGTPPAAKPAATQSGACALDGSVAPPATPVQKRSNTAIQADEHAKRLEWKEAAAKARDVIEHPTDDDDQGSRELAEYTLATALFNLHSEHESQVRLGKILDQPHHPKRQDAATWLCVNFEGKRAAPSEADKGMRAIEVVQDAQRQMARFFTLDKAYKTLQRLKTSAHDRTEMARGVVTGTPQMCIGKNCQPVNPKASEAEATYLSLFSPQVLAQLEAYEKKIAEASAVEPVYQTAFTEASKLQPITESVGTAASLSAEQKAANEKTVQTATAALDAFAKALSNHSTVDPYADFTRKADQAERNAHEAIRARVEAHLDAFRDIVTKPGDELTKVNALYSVVPIQTKAQYIDQLPGLRRQFCAQKETYRRKFSEEQFAEAAAAHCKAGVLGISPPAGTKVDVPAACTRSYNTPCRGERAQSGP